MQLILDTVPVLREEDRQELLRVMPSYVNHNWEVRRSLKELLPEVEDEGERNRTEIYKHIFLIIKNKIF